MQVPPGFPLGSLPGPGQPPGRATASGSSGARCSAAQDRNHSPQRPLAALVFLAFRRGCRRPWSRISAPL